MNLLKEIFATEERKKLPFWKRLFTKSLSFQLFDEYSVKFEVEYHIPLEHGTKTKLLANQIL